MNSYRWGGAGEVQWPVLSALGLAWRAAPGPVTVLDFGGSLGSLYFQHREQCRVLGVSRWTVIEQPSFVEAGRECLADGTLSFCADLDAVLADGQSTVAVLSGVLQYVEPYLDPLRQVLDRRVPVVCVDRTYLSQDNRSLLVQHVPKEIYAASYPCHVIRVSDVEDLFRQSGYTVLASYVNGGFPALERRGGYFGGFIALADQRSPTDD